MSIDATARGARTWTAARGWHGLTALVAGASLIAQFVVILNDGNEDTTVIRYFSYFTILSNIAVCAVAAILARQPDHDGQAFRLFRLVSVVCITVTGLVHYTLLRPLPEVQDLTGWSQICDIGLHIVVPILVFVGWLVFGPRPRIDMRTIGLSVLLPIAWLGYTLLHGAVSDWYPYPFVNVIEHGYGTVLLNCLGVAVLYLVCCALAHLADRRLRPVPTPER